MNDRLQQAAETNQREIVNAKRMHRATHWVATVPELCVNGQPCPWAVMGALWLKDEHNGNTTEFIKKVSRFQQQQLRRVEARLGPQGET